jgi:hypothetical protein
MAIASFFLPVPVAMAKSMFRRSSARPAFYDFDGALLVRAERESEIEGPRF